MRMQIGFVAISLLAPALARPVDRVVLGYDIYNAGNPTTTLYVTPDNGLMYTPKTVYELDPGSGAIIQARPDLWWNTSTAKFAGGEDTAERFFMHYSTGGGIYTPVTYGFRAFVRQTDGSLASAGDISVGFMMTDGPWVSGDGTIVVGSGCLSGNRANFSPAGYWLGHSQLYMGPTSTSICTPTLTGVYAVGPGPHFYVIRRASTAATYVDGTWFSSTTGVDAFLPDRGSADFFAVLSSECGNLDIYRFEEEGPSWQGLLSSPEYRTTLWAQRADGVLWASARSDVIVIHLWDRDALTLTEVDRITGTGITWTGLRFTPDGRRLYAGTPGGTTMVVQLADAPPMPPATAILDGSVPGRMYDVNRDGLLDAADAVMDGMAP